jgi:hypothetical protein
MTLAIARRNVSGENGLEWLNDAGDPHRTTFRLSVREDR